MRWYAKLFAVGMSAALIAGTAGPAAAATAPGTMSVSDDAALAGDTTGIATAGNEAGYNETDTNETADDGNETDDNEPEDENETSFGLRVSSFVQDLKTPEANTTENGTGNGTENTTEGTSEPLGLLIASFVTANNPGNAPDHAGPPAHAGPGDDKTDQIGPPGFSNKNGTEDGSGPPAWANGNETDDAESDQTDTDGHHHGGPERDGGPPADPGNGGGPER